MQNCFRQHPDVYGEELDGDEAEGEEPDQGSPVAITPKSEPSDNKTILSDPEKPINQSSPDQPESKNNHDTILTTR